MESCSIDIDCRGFQHSKVCTSLNTSHLKPFIILQLLSFHRDLLEITTFLSVFILFCIHKFWFSLTRFSGSLPWYLSPSAGVQTEPRATTSPFLSRTRWDTCKHYLGLWLSCGSSHECQGPARPQVTRVHTRAELWAVTRTRREPAGNASQASPVSTGTNETAEQGRPLQHFKAATGDF